MKWMRIVLVMIMSLHIASAQDCTRADILIACDFSDSIDGHENELVSALEVFVKNSNVSTENIQIGFLVFSSEAHLYLPVSGNREVIRQSLDLLRTRSGDGGTRLDRAVDAGADVLRNHSSRRAYVHKVLVIISDGCHHDAYDNSLSYAISRTHKDGLEPVMLFTIFVGDVYCDNEKEKQGSRRLQNMVPDGHYFATNYENLAQVLSEIDPCI